jgi:hypothetical protein
VITLPISYKIKFHVYLLQGLVVSMSILFEDLGALLCE